MKVHSGVAGEQFPQFDEEDRWLKRTVSLPALSREPRPLMWQRAEGLEESRTGSAPSPTHGDRFSLETLDFRTPARPSSQACHFSKKKTLGAEAEDVLCGGGSMECAGKESVFMDKRKRMKKIDLAARESAHVDKHRQLKVMLREQRKMDRSLSCARHLVGHLERNKDGPWRRKMIDQQKMEKSVNRIAGHLHGCSHARHELQEMQKKMAFALSPGPTAAVSFDLRHAFEDAVGRPHADYE